MDVLAVTETTVGAATAAASSDEDEVAAVTEFSVDCAALLIDSIEL